MPVSKSKGCGECWESSNLLTERSVWLGLGTCCGREGR